MNIVITGAGSGIGYQTAKLLAQNPANKVIAISQNPQNLQNLQKPIRPDPIEGW